MASTTEAIATPADATPAPSGLVAGYGLAVLFLANMLNFADRALLGIVVDPIKADVGLSDTQISLMSGVAFSLFYLIAGIAIARWVDRGTRRLILAIGITIWSAATAATGLAHSFETLALTRLMVGVGEATMFPVAMSLLADLYPGSRLPRSVSIFQASAGIGIMAGSILAGILAAAHGWRSMFAIIGAAGVVVVMLIALMRPTPRTKSLAREAVEPSKLLPALRSILTIPGLGWLSFGYGASHMLPQCLPVWAPAFLHRSHGIEIADVGVFVGPPAVIGGFLGAILSGVLATRLIRRSGDRRAGLLVPIVGLPLAMPAFAVFLFSPSLTAVWVAVLVLNFMISTSLGPCVALAVSMVGPSRRALTSTLMLIVQTVVGAAFGPTIVGVVSDLVAPTFGADSLRYGLAIMLIAPLIASLLIWVSKRRITPA